MSDSIQILLILIISFFVGSVPTAYLLVRKHSGKDLRDEGSGNIGTLNAFEVTGNTFIAVSVLISDVLKGFLVTLIAGSIATDGFIASSVAMVAVVAGHNYSPWIGWKGGRGLAPAAGAALAFNPLLPALWCLYWLLIYAKSRNVHVGNIAASILSPCTIPFADTLFMSASCHTVSAFWHFMIPILVLYFLILIRHFGPLREMYRARSS